MGFGFDEASWIPTALNMATMFSGVFVCFLSVLFGPRRILLPAAAIFAVASALLPFAPNYWANVGLGRDRRLASGTFYSLTMTFVLTALPKRLIIFGIAAYAADIVFVSNIASIARRLVCRVSILALDLLDCRGGHAIDDDLYLFRNSAAASRGAEAELARIRLFQPRPQPSLRRSGSRGAAGLVELRRNRRDARRRESSCWRRRWRDGYLQPNPTVKSCLSQQAQHHHSRLIDFCI